MIILAKVIELTLFPAVMAFAASSDLFTMTIANRVSIILVAGFATLAVLTGMSASDLMSHLGAAAAVLAVVFVFFACGWIGGGDAKLAAATALWLGFANLLDYLVYASLFGGALTLAIVYYRGMPMPPVFIGLPWAERLHRSDCGVPYGIALGGRSAGRLPAHQLDGGDRPLSRFERGDAFFCARQGPDKASRGPRR